MHIHMIIKHLPQHIKARILPHLHQTRAARRTHRNQQFTQKWVFECYFAETDVYLEHVGAGVEFWGVVVAVEGEGGGERVVRRTRFYYSVFLRLHVKQSYVEITCQILPLFPQQIGILITLHKEE